DVAAPGVVARIDDLAHLEQPGGGHRAAAAAHLKEVRFVELPRLGGVRDEHRLERAVLAPQALHHPEEEGLGELAVAVRHAARDIEHEEHHRVHGWLPPPRELPEAQVLVGESGGRSGSAAALHQLLERATSVEARACPATVPAFAYPIGLARWVGPRLEIRQLHFLPEPIDDVVDLELQQQLHLALVAPAGTLLAGSAVARGVGEHIAGLRLALASALL